MDNELNSDDTKEATQRLIEALHATSYIEYDLAELIAKCIRDLVICQQTDAIEYLNAGIEAAILARKAEVDEETSSFLGESEERVSETNAILSRLANKG